ncbi:hypothetical protein GUITHDRAFT_148635 [Guillardia theta CCMP2712]|uniref:Uncharacterized protein n=1 Tax=Guillardia theta (strain CCMP2712) TaxID=905079 RepID=L1I954_GUITC|nr:hypothetical protein GUITHDRAFT_148635 [Guillardia theta CCMP2712]EKX32429.1 hypothetical protein GUITHDRAFT_148635 [Guillardia theta CCMP2712]|eukprot:XP_005819409.1 hypothetical protein GUITHDRAFT_148635 [Guillardia theta CCMP2712]
MLLLLTLPLLPTAPFHLLLLPSPPSSFAMAIAPRPRRLPSASCANVKLAASSTARLFLALSSRRQEDAGNAGKTGGSNLTQQSNHDPKYNPNANIVQLMLRMSEKMYPERKNY